MRFLADENIPASLVNALRSVGTAEMSRIFE
jgi:hypothetical protein